MMTRTIKIILIVKLNLIKKIRFDMRYSLNVNEFM
jgi:hypothetical protein